MQPPMPFFLVPMTCNVHDFPRSTTAHNLARLFFNLLIPPPLLYYLFPFSPCLTLLPFQHFTFFSFASIARTSLRPTTLLDNGANESDLVNPDRKALADCYNNPQAVSSASGLMGIAPFLHTLFCVPEVRVLDFVIQPLKQLLVEIIDCNPCGQAMPASQCQEIYNVFEVLVLGIASG